MAEHPRFSAKMLSKAKMQSKMKVSRRPVRPTLRLSKAALETPLPDGFLSDVRDFLTRSGRWKGHTLDSLELFMAIPAPGVRTRDPLPGVIGPDEPVFTSVGFGMEGAKDGVANYSQGVCEIHESDSRCDTYLCITYATMSRPPRQGAESIDPQTCYASHCKTNSCGINTCSSQLCSTQKCIMHECSDHLCSEQTSIALSSELEAHWNHPFVQEIGRYFRLDMGENLATAVMHYVGRNMFDESAR